MEIKKLGDLGHQRNRWDFFFCMETWEVSIDFEEFDGPPIPSPCLPVSHRGRCQTSMDTKRIPSGNFLHSEAMLHENS